MRIILKAGVSCHALLPQWRSSWLYLRGQCFEAAQAPAPCMKEKHANAADACYNELAYSGSYPSI